MGLSISAYARHRAEKGLKGQTHVAVIKALQAGRIVKEPDGTIDPVKADAAWNTNTDPAQQRQQKTEKLPVPKTEPRPKPAAPPPDSDSASPQPTQPGAPSYAQSRAIREAYAARLSKLEYEEKLGQLIKADKVRIAWFQTMRVVRDRLLNLPARLAAQLAAEGDERAVRSLLDEELRKALVDAADAMPGTGHDR